MYTNAPNLIIVSLDTKFR